MSDNHRRFAYEEAVAKSLKMEIRAITVRTKDWKRFHVKLGKLDKSKKCFDSVFF